MAKLSGKDINDVVVEFIGPINNRNFFFNTITPVVIIKIIGTGQVQVQQTQEFDITGVDGDDNPYTKTKTPINWVNAGAPIGSSAGIASVAITPDDIFSAIRVIVSTPGDGDVTIESRWR